MGKKSKYGIEDYFIPTCLFIYGFLSIYMFIVTHKLVALVVTIFFFTLGISWLWMILSIIGVQRNS
jgi:hypothetical protein